MTAPDTSTWRKPPVLRWLADQPVQRRQTILAAVFAVVAAVWAPLGVLALLTSTTPRFAIGTVVAVVVVAAPRPVLAEGAVTDRLAAVATWLRDDLRDEAMRVVDWLLRAVRRLDERIDGRRPTNASS